MRSGLVNVLVRQLRRTAGEPRHADADLVRRFAAERDPEAFAELVRRHGPLVWGVCRRSLANRADAEDAFQATLLVFARNARSIRKPESLGAWLHGVAHRVAQRVRVRGESLQTEPVSPAPSCHESLTLREFLAALDDELAALPDKYRGPLVLCFLQERTQDDAARRLGVSLSTLKRRLDAGRELLRGRLTRRGVELPAVLLAAGLSEAVPAALAEGAVRAATVGAAGVVSANVLTITEGVIRAMWETKLRTWVVGVLVATAAAGGTGYFAYTGQAQTGAGKQPANQPAGKKPDPRERVWAAELDAARAEVMIAEATLQRTQNDLDRIQQLVKSGVASATELSKAEAFAEEARAQLLRARANLEITAAKIDAERAKATIDDDLRRSDADRNTRLEQYERSFRAQSVLPELQKLREEKVKTMQAALTGMVEARNQGQVVAQTWGAQQEAYYTRSKFLLTAERELSVNPQAQLKAARDHLARMKDLETYGAVRAKAYGRKEEGEAVRAYRIEAEIWAKEAELGALRNPDPRNELSRTYDRGGFDADRTRSAEPNRVEAERTKPQADDLARRLTQLEGSPGEPRRGPAGAGHGDD